MSPRRFDPEEVVVLNRANGRLHVEVRSTERDYFGRVIRTAPGATFIGTPAEIEERLGYSLPPEVLEGRRRD